MVEKYVHKGSKLYIEGKIRSRTYVDRENQSHFVTEIAVDVLELLSPREPREGYSQSRDNMQNESYGSLGEPQDDDDANVAASDFNTPF